MEPKSIGSPIRACSESSSGGLGELIGKVRSISELRHLETGLCCG